MFRKEHLRCVVIVFPLSYMQVGTYWMVLNFVCLNMYLYGRLVESSDGNLLEKCSAGEMSPGWMWVVITVCVALLLIAAIAIVVYALRNTQTFRILSACEYIVTHVVTSLSHTRSPDHSRRLYLETSGPANGGCDWWPHPDRWLRLVVISSDSALLPRARWPSSANATHFSGLY